MADVTYSVEELAQSCFRASCAAVGAEVPHGWDGLSLQDQAPFIRLGQFGPVRLEQLENASYVQAAREMWKLSLGPLAESADNPWEQLPRRVRGAWEAVTRHLMTLIDADDVQNVAELEKSWRQWLAERLTPQEATA